MVLNVNQAYHTSLNNSVVLNVNQAYHKSLNDLVVLNVNQAYHTSLYNSVVLNVFQLLHNSFNFFLFQSWVNVTHDVRCICVSNPDLFGTMKIERHRERCTPYQLMLMVPHPPVLDIQIPHPPVLAPLVRPTLYSFTQKYAKI